MLRGSTLFKLQPFSTEAIVSDIKTRLKQNAVETRMKVLSAALAASFNEFVPPKMLE
jgi:hypothetical protein